MSCADFWEEARAPSREAHVGGEELASQGEVGDELIGWR